MKKNRPGLVLSVLAPPGRERAIESVLFEETTTWDQAPRSGTRRAAA